MLTYLRIRHMKNIGCRLQISPIKSYSHVEQKDAGYEKKGPKFRDNGSSKLVFIEEKVGG